MSFVRLYGGVLALGCFLASCGDKSSYSDLNTQDVTLPGGQTIHVEAMIRPIDQARGLMFRTSLAPDRGMLFIRKTAGLYSTWMYQHRMPLDVIWMDRSRTIVEMVENAPPCQTVASQCPHFGGTKASQYILELAGGMARKYDLHLGQRLDF